MKNNALAFVILLFPIGKNVFPIGTSQNTLYKQYKERYPDMSDEQIMSLVRECQMYGE